MGTVILALTFVFEVAFASYCIFTKSRQTRVRSLFRIGALAAFVLFTLLSVLQWGLRWYLLAILLLIGAALGAWTLLRNKEEPKEFGVGRSVLSAFGAFVLVLIVLVPAFMFPQYTPPRVTGTHAVATVNATYTDPSRIETFAATGEHREVNVEFWYPQDGSGKYPLVVFDHGIMGLKTSNTSTFLELASNGYVVCSIDHPYLSLFTVDDSGHRAIIDTAYLQEYMDVSNGKYEEPTSTQLEQKWIGWRTADINFVLDTILAKAKDDGSGAVYQKIDSNHIGLMGHSLGGESSAQVARERNDIGAVVDLDADLVGEYVDYRDGKWALSSQPYPVPLLIVLSDALERLIGAYSDPSGIALNHVQANSPTVDVVHLPGTDHMSFTDAPLTMPLLVTVINASVPKAGGQEANPLATLEKMNDSVLKFFDAYLKNE